MRNSPSPLLLVAAALATALLAPACGASDASSAETSDAGTFPSAPYDGGAPPAALEVPRTASPACAAYGAAVCKRHARCSTEAFEKDERTIAYCTARTALECAVTEKARGVAPMAPECARAIDAQSCEELEEPASCGRLGALANGARCNFDSQCASGACVGAVTHLGTCGVCKTAPHVTVVPPSSLGEACSADRACAFPYTCHDGICIADGLREGAACDMREPTTGCGPDLVCIDEQCATPNHLGDECFVNAFHDTCSITEHLSCEWSDAFAAYRCVPRHPLEVGGACSSSSGWCPAYATCAGTPASSRCTARVEDGEACTIELGPDCAGPYSRCVHGSCTPVGPPVCE